MIVSNGPRFNRLRRNLHPAYTPYVILQVGVRLSDGREIYARTIISNATRWDTFGKFG